MFACVRCGYESSTKQNLLRHLRRVVVCDAILNDIAPDEIIQELTHKTYNDTACSCEFCGKKFNHRSNMYTHKKTCPKKQSVNNKIQADEIEDLKAEIAEIRKWKESMENIPSHGKQSHNHLLGYTEVDTSYIENNLEFIKKCTQESSANAVRCIVDKIYFDTHYINNNAIKMKNFKLNQVMVLMMVNGHRDIYLKSYLQSLKILRMSYINTSLL